MKRVLCVFLMVVLLMCTVFMNVSCSQSPEELQQAEESVKEKYDGWTIVAIDATAYYSSTSPSSVFTVTALDEDNNVHLKTMRSYQIVIDDTVETPYFGYLKSGVSDLGLYISRTQFIKMVSN